MPSWVCFVWKDVRVFFVWQDTVYGWFQSALLGQNAVQGLFCVARCRLGFVSGGTFRVCFRRQEAGHVRHARRDVVCLDGQEPGHVRQVTNRGNLYGTQWGKFKKNLGH